MSSTRAPTTAALSVRVENAGEVGKLARSDLEPKNTRFRYADSVLEPDAVSLVMPVRGDDYIWERGIHPIFDMHLPEGILRHQLLTLFSKTAKGFDDFNLLGIVGPHQLGRIRVGAEYGEPFPDTALEELLVYDGARGLFDDLMDRYARFSGVSGVQPKVLIRDSESTGINRLTHKSATHLLKAWREEDYPQLAANEYFCMRAAMHAGLVVPKFYLSANAKFLVVERFDINDQGYLGFEDFCVLNGWPSNDKYDGSYEGCARQIKAFLSPERVTEGLESLFMIVALSAGVQNGDAHLKNFGVLYPHCGDDADVRLAPAYDIVSTTPYKPQDIMALMIAGSKAWPKHKILLQFGRVACGLSEERCAGLLEQVVDSISMAAVEMKEYMQDHPSFEEMGARMSKAWSTGMRRSLMPEQLPLTVDLGAKKGKGPRL